MFARRRRLQRENVDLRDACQQAFEAIAFSYGGSHPDQLEDPEDKAMSAAMHRLYRMGFGRRVT